MSTSLVIVRKMKKKKKKIPRNSVLLRLCLTSMNASMKSHEAIIGNPRTSTFGCVKTMKISTVDIAGFFFFLHSFNNVVVARKCADFRERYITDHPAVMRYFVRTDRRYSYRCFIPLPRRISSGSFFSPRARARKTFIENDAKRTCTQLL